MAEQVLSMSKIYPGDVVKFTSSVVDPDDGVTAVDPDTFVITVQDPDGEETAYTYGVDAAFLRSDVGDYSLEITPDAAGVWYVRAATTTPDDVDEYFFRVESSPF
jgi:hypothetical protein